MRTVEQLIEILSQYPMDMRIAIYDVNKNIHEQCSGPCSDGIHDDFEILVVPSDEEMPDMLEEYPDCKQWLAFQFENDDYEV